MLFAATGLLLGPAPAPVLAATDSIAAVTSPRQAGSPDFEAEQRRADVEPLALQLVYKADILAGLGGGYRNQIGYLGNLDVKITVAGERAFGLGGATLFAHLLHNHGAKPNKQIGTLQGVDNIEVGTNTGKVLQLWYQQQLLDDRLSLLVGLYDLNTEFYVTDSSSVFVHPALGAGSELAQTGANGPSIFPTTSVGLRVRANLSEAAYAQAVVLDGVPGNPANPRGTHIRFDRGDGALWAVETGYRPAPSEGELEVTKLAAGHWRYARRFNDQLDVDQDGAPVKRKNYGFYLLAERTLWRDAADAQRGLTAFVRYGAATPAVNPIDRALALGAVYQGLLPSRGQDTLGFAIAAARTSAKFRSSAEPAMRREIAYELTYRAPVNAWLAIQPELQHIRSADSGAAPATLASVRLEASF